MGRSSMAPSGTGQVNRWPEPAGWHPDETLTLAGQIPTDSFGYRAPMPASATRP